MSTTHFTTGGEPARVHMGPPSLEGARDIPRKSWIVCDAGHRICFTHRGLKVGEHVNSWASRLSRWQQTQPKIGERIDWKCEECGASWGPVMKAEPA